MKAEWESFFVGDFLKNVPHTPQKLPKKGYMYPRKEVRT